MDEIMWHRRESRRQTENTNVILQSRESPVYSQEDIWVTTRATPDDEWGIPRNLGRPVNSPLHEDSPRLSPDGSTLYFNRGTGFFVFGPWRAPIVPIVDFNGDGQVDITDLLRLIDRWGQNEPAVDIAPPPSGDGIVDAKDLEVLMSTWGQEVNDPTLTACWKLDEAEGTVAVDIAGTANGTLVGDPIWQPAGGKIGGALLFDGRDDYVSTGLVLDPTVGPFSVFAWVKDGLPGQAILSQDKGANWLLAAAPKGEFTTELKSGRGGPLVSPSIVTDGAWHRVGFVRDGSDRILYVDDVEVARDVVSSLPGSTGSMQIGAGSKLAAGTFWSGLIDDVRIYDRAVKP